MEESSSNPANSVTPFQRFLGTALPASTLQKALQEDPKDSSSRASQNRPKKSRFSPESVAILKHWLDEHKDYPYPGSEDKVALAASAHLSVSQVSNWFVNCRQRKLPRKLQMSPMEVWLSSSSDDEAASEHDIRQALKGQLNQCSLASDVNYPTAARLKIRGTPEYTSVPFYKPTFDARSVSAGSMSSAGSTRSQCSAPLHKPTFDARSVSAGSMSSAGSAFSQCQDAVLSGLPRRGRKRRYGLTSTPSQLDGGSGQNTSKKRKTASVVEGESWGSPSDLSFQCTFCHKRLSSKTWKRHEATQHLPQHQWTCLKDGFQTVYNPLICQKSVEGFLSPPKSMCVFCNSPDPDESHAVSCHRISQCLKNPESDRTFSRKDHLVQHLRRFHNSSLSSFFLESWKSKTELDDFEWNCGFCGDSLRGWDIRANHISKHFRERKTMADWCSNRGVYGPFECLCCPKDPRKFQNVSRLR